jgi:predicted hydrocarbon binding protein
MSTDDLVAWGVNSMSFAGWGKLSVANFDIKNKRAIGHLQESTFAKKYGPSKEPIDHMVRGFAAASGCIYFNIDCDCVETKCISTGSNICEFVIKKTADFEDSELVRKQLPFLFKEMKKTR